MFAHLIKDRRRYVAMEFRRFILEMIIVACDVIRRSRRDHAPDHRVATLDRPAHQHLGAIGRAGCT